MSRDALQDLSTISTFPYFTLRGIASKLEDVISYNLQESIANKEDYCELDIGIGKLIIGVDTDLRFKFIPSSTLENNVIDVVKGKECSLITNVENSIKTRVISAYKELY